MASDMIVSAKRRIVQWIEGLVVGGAAVPPAMKAELLKQLAAASPEPANDGAIELVLPGLSSLGMGIFRHSFRQEATHVRVVPYGNC
jgi:hypothetical protein